MSRKISSRNDNQQRNTQARAQQQHSEPKPRRVRRMGAAADLYQGQGRTPEENHTPYAAAPAQAPGIAPLRMQPVLALAMLANVVLQGAQDALAPAQQPLPLLPTPAQGPTRRHGQASPAALVPARSEARHVAAAPASERAQASHGPAAPKRRLLQDAPATSTGTSLQQAADAIRNEPCQAMGALDALSADPAINSTQAAELKLYLRDDALQAAGLTPIWTQNEQAAFTYDSLRRSSSQGGYYGWNMYYAQWLVAGIDNCTDHVNAAQFTLACAAPDGVNAARANLSESWASLHDSERNFWDWSKSDMYIMQALDQFSNYTTEGIIPDAATIAGFQRVPANLSGAGDPGFAPLFDAADTLKLFDTSRNASTWAQTGSTLLNRPNTQSLLTPSGVNRVMAPLAQQINGTLGSLLASLQVNDTTAAVYDQLDSHLLPTLTRAHIATVQLVGDDAHVDSLWNQANTTGASPSVLQNMRAARAAWQSVRRSELAQLAPGKQVWNAQVAAIANASRTPASVAEGPIPLLRTDLLPEVMNSSAYTQQTFAQIRDAASLNASAWQAVVDLGAAQPALQDALLFGLGNLDSQAVARGEGPQQHFMEALAINATAPQRLYTSFTAQTNSSFSQGWQKLLSQSNLGQDTAGQKVRWSEWVALKADLNTMSPSHIDSASFASAMQAIGLPVRSVNDLAFGSSAALSVGNGTTATYPALSALNGVQVSNSWRDATVKQLQLPWASTGVVPGTRYYAPSGSPTSDASAQALATLLGLRLQTGQGDIYPAAYEALVGKPPSSLQQKPDAPVVGVDDLLNSLWPEAKQRVRYNAGAQRWEAKPLAASWDGSQTQSVAALDGLTITSRSDKGKKKSQDLAGWVKDAITLRCKSYGTCAEDLTRY